MSAASRLTLALVVSCAVGFISLSLEIVWFSAFSFAAESRAGMFGFALGAFLFGIGGGAWLGFRQCARKNTEPFLFIAAVLMIAAAVNFLGIPVISKIVVLADGILVQFGNSRILNTAVFLAFQLGSMFLVAFFLGGVLPVLCEGGFGNRTGDKDGYADGQIGQFTSWVYAANILGATTGPLLTGFVLMSRYSLDQMLLAASAALLVLGLAVLLAAPSRPRQRIGGVVAATLLAAGMGFGYPALYGGQTLERIHFKNAFRPDTRFKHKVHNRSGIVAIQADPRGDIIYGHGIYDGRFNLDPVNDSNGITRAYAFATLHRNPKDMLEIGLSGGSWARVVLDYPKVKSMTVVEINPGYFEVIRKYPENATILNDPRVTYYIDDGRRWLNRNPDRKFDFILINTTFHWRENITNLLSEEFLRLGQAHLNPGGVMYWNTTDSKDVIYTASTVFKYVVRFAGFVAGSDSPFDMTVAEKRKALLSYRNNGKSIFRPEDEKSREVLERLSNHPFVNVRDRFLAGGHRLITDDSMASEFKRPWWY